MKFPNIINRKEMYRAIIYGCIAGLSGVILFIVLLYVMDRDEEEMIPVQSSKIQQEQQQEPVIIEEFTAQFYAKQHGVFTSNEAAMEFVSQYPSLNTSAIVEVDENYYVWSSVSPIKEDLQNIDEPSSFVKSFTLNASSCSKPKLQNLPANLKNTDPSKFYFEKGEAPEHLPEDWVTITLALSSLSDDLSVVRMHLLAHYFTKNDCLKIQF